MTEVTLQAVRAKQAELATMIATLMNQPATTICVEEIEIELREGEHYAGAVLDDGGEVKHHLVLMADKPTERLSWQAANDWAKSVGGGLPNRQEQALLFANCKAHMDADWHWSSEAHESNESYAWTCYFGGGDQGHGRKSSAGSARAVRRLNA